MGRRKLMDGQPIDLHQPGRLRVPDVMRLLRIGETTLWDGIRSKRYPAPDGKDGGMTYWKTATIKAFLER